MRLILSATILSASILLAAGTAAAQPATPTNYQGTLQLCTTARGEQSVHLEAGHRYHITAASSAFDTVLRVYRPGNDTALAENDDAPGGQGTNSALTFVPPETGDYLVRVTSLAPDGAGAYTMNVESLGPLPPPITAAGDATETTTWHVYRAALSNRDTAEEGMYFKDYQVNLQAGRPVMVGLASAAFDTVVKVYRADQRGGEPLASNDDGGDGTNSFLTFTPDHAGAYIVRVTSFAANATGAYQLRVGQ